MISTFGHMITCLFHCLPYFCIAVYFTSTVFHWFFSCDIPIKLSVGEHFAPSVFITRIMSWHHGHSKDAREESKRLVAEIMSAYDEPGTWSLQYRVKVLCCQKTCPYYGSQGKGKFGEHWQHYTKDFWENWPGHGWREFNEYLNDKGRRTSVAIVKIFQKYANVGVLIVLNGWSAWW